MKDDLSLGPKTHLLVHRALNFNFYRSLCHSLLIFDSFAGYLPSLSLSLFFTVALLFVFRKKTAFTVS